jgi:hypothetical protein
VKAHAEWTARTEEPVALYSASKRGNVIGISSSAKHQASDHITPRLQVGDTTAPDLQS